MADFRQVYTKMWTEDNWFVNQDRNHRYLFMYLFTNNHTSPSGMYEIPLRVMAFETDFAQDELSKLLTDFEMDGKVFFEKGIVWVANMRKYQETRSEKLQQRIEADIRSVPDCAIKRRYCIQYGYPVHTVPIGGGHNTTQHNTTQHDTSQYDTSQDDPATTASYKVSPIYKMYENEIGALTSTISQELGEYADLPEEWLKCAFIEAVNNNVRKWSYVKAILKSWKAAGKMTSKKTDPAPVQSHEYIV